MKSDYPFMEKKKANKPLFGFNLTFASPDLVEFMGRLGFDYVFIDAEHFSFDPETIQSIARVAELANILPMARVPKNDPQLIQSYLETGILGIVVPHIKTAFEAEKMVEAVKYFPLGKRGVSTRSRAAGYGLTDPPLRYFELTNQQTIVIPMIEEAEAVKNLPEILLVPGIDYIDIGPSDLAMSMGHPDVDHPEVEEAINHIKTLVLASKKGLVFPVSTVEDGEKAIREGASLIEFNTNAFLQRDARNFLSHLSGIS
jgi:2-keto-3-deoxy-L-rhamnonate aldolase RhmA